MSKKRQGSHPDEIESQQISAREQNLNFPVFSRVLQIIYRIVQRVRGFDEVEKIDENHLRPVDLAQFFRFFYRAEKFCNSAEGYLLVTDAEQFPVNGAAESADLQDDESGSRRGRVDQNFHQIVRDVVGGEIFERHHRQTYNQSVDQN